jgi:hypothetical protein
MWWKTEQTQESPANPDTAKEKRLKGKGHHTTKKHATRESKCKGGKQNNKTTEHSN